MTTLAEKWFEEGRQEGHREGRREGERQATLNIIETGLRMKFGVDGARLFADVVKIENLRMRICGYWNASGPPKAWTKSEAVFKGRRENN